MKKELPNENTLKDLDDLKTALEEKDRLLQSIHDEKFLIESDRDHLDEKIKELKEEIKKKDEEILKLRQKIKKFDKFRQDMLSENQKTREELTGKLDKVNGDLEFMRDEFKFMHSAMNELLTGAKKNKKTKPGWNGSSNTQNKKINQS